MLGLALRLVLATTPAVTLDEVDARGCGVVHVGERRVAGAAAGLCVKQALWTRLEGGLAALPVEAPHRFDPRVRPRVFLYRLAGARLAPRFLGSGFRARDIVRLVPLADALGVVVRGVAGLATLVCRFDGFPLACQESP